LVTISGHRKSFQKKRKQNTAKVAIAAFA